MSGKHFRKISVKRRRAEKFNGQIGRPDEWPQNPRKLAAEEKIPCQPRDQHAKRDGPASAQPSERLKQAHIARRARERDDGDVGEFD